MAKKPARIRLVTNSNGMVSVYTGTKFDSIHYGKSDLGDRLRALISAGHAAPKQRKARR